MGMGKRIRRNDRPITQDELADWLTLPLQMRRGDREVWVRVHFYRKDEDGTTRRVSTAGPSPAVPVTYCYDGVDWDNDRTFMATPVPLYADWDEWREWVRSDKEEC